MSRARLAYLIDSTSAPICILILLNGWGAFVLGMLDTYELPASSASILWGSVFFNFYAIIALLIAAYTVFADKVHGPMAKAEQQLQSNQQQLSAAAATKPGYMHALRATDRFGFYHGTIGCFMHGFEYRVGIVPVQFQDIDGTGSF